MTESKLISVYGRVSTSNQEDQKTIEAQLSEVRRFAQERGYTIVKEYIDEGWSGDILARPALDQLRHDAKDKIWDAVLIYDPDRLGRRLFYQQIVIDELKQIGKEILFVTTPPVINAGDELMFGVKGLFAQYEKTKIAERFRIGKVNRVKNNQILLSEAPYGYSYIPNKGKRGNADYLAGHCEINATEAQIVKEIFNWVGNDHMTLRAIVRKLLELGIKPRKSTRGVWNTSTLSTLLRNTTYIGKAHYGASIAIAPIKPFSKETYRKNKKTSRKMRPEVDWITISTPAIIDDDLFYRTGKQLKSNFELSSRNTKNEYLLAGRIWCTCGLRRAGEGPQKGKHLYYRCTDRVKSFPLAPTCKARGLNARIVDEMIWNKTAEIMSSPELLLEQSKRWLNGNLQTFQNSMVNVEELKYEIDKLKKQDDRYLNAYGSGAINLETYKDCTAPIKEKISQYIIQINSTQTNDNIKSERCQPTIDEINNFSQKVSQSLKDLNFKAKKAIINNIIDKVVETTEGLQVYGYIPVTSNINVFTEHRNGVNTPRHEGIQTNQGNIPIEFSITLP